MKRRRSSHLCARLVHGAASKSRHTPRMRGTPQPLDSMINGSGILDHPLSRVMTAGVCYRFEFQTALLCTNTASRSRRAFRASFASNPPSQIRGRRECRAPGAPAASRVVKNTRVSHHGHAGSAGIPHAMVLTGSFALSPVTGLVATVIGGNTSTDLTPASGRQDHTTSPSASSAVRHRHHQRPPHPTSRS
jgi:hypothetical protein